MDPQTHFDGPRMACPTSRRSRDLAALRELRRWLDHPVFPWDTTISRRQLETAQHFCDVTNRLGAEAACRNAAKGAVSVGR